jgi:hypothetical protein
VSVTRRINTTFLSEAEVRALLRLKQDLKQGTRERAMEIDPMLRETFAEVKQARDAKAQAGANWDPLALGRQQCGSRFMHRRREFEAAMAAAERRLGGLAPDELTVCYDPITGICTASLGEEQIYQTPINLRLPLAAPDSAEEAGRLVGQLAQQILAQRGQIHRLQAQLAKSRVLVREVFKFAGEGA